ncbi:hypothetical protein GOP47_0004690 [Adiantum capillus-veneris]|uniref:Uncharacterized protein n=1 Tax=Adiantum capillus-veneris TaxID=13818 RepID=A0A9D4V9Q3_ADICA|nr:hypothetical protein GOP47_0004690 [Adiantum capillus-veneris]
MSLELYCWLYWLFHSLLHITKNIVFRSATQEGIAHIAFVVRTCLFMKVNSTTCLFMKVNSTPMFLVKVRFSVDLHYWSMGHSQEAFLVRRTGVSGWYASVNCVRILYSGFFLEQKEVRVQIFSKLA